VILGDTPLSKDHVVGIEKSKCVSVPKGSCVNVEDDDGKFLFSFKSPDNFYACGNGTEICKETPQTNELTIYSEKNCQGTSSKSRETLLFCSPV